MTNIVLVSMLIGAVIGSGLLFFLMRNPHKKLPAHREPAGYSEKDAEEMLRRAGFEITGAREKANVITNINGKDHFGFVEIDYIVRKGRKEYAVAVKSGEGGADPNDPVLRRRLIEYEHILAPDGLLVLDVFRGEIHRVSFRFPKEKSIDKFFKILIAILVIFGVLGIIWMLSSLKLI